VAEAERRLAAIVAMDVAGYSRLMGEDEQGTLLRLTEHRAVIDPIGSEHGGRIVGTAGDGVLVEFPSVIEAVGFALRCQATMAERNADLPDDEKMLFRIGINLGDVLVQNDDIFGDGVNVAARIEALAEPGGVCISRTVRDNVRDRMDIDFDDMGEVEVKNIARPVRVFRVSAEPDVVAAIKPTATPTAATSRRPKWRLIAAAAALLAVVVAGGGYWWWQQPDFEPADPDKFAFELPEKPSIAVLPFDNLSDDESQGFIGDGLAENIIAALATSPDLLVIARNSTFVYKGKPTKVQTIAEQLGVRFVLEGSVQRSGEKLRVTAQLIDAVNGRHLWAGRFDRTMGDLFAVFDEITQSVLVAMQVKLTLGSQISHWQDLSKDPELFRLFVQYQSAFDKTSRVGNKKAEEYIRAAQKIDDRAFSLAMAWIRLQRVMLHFSEDPRTDIKAAIASAEKYRAAYGETGSYHAFRSSTDLWTKKYAAALDHAAKAVELSPSHGTNLAIAAMTNIWSGKPEAGITLMKRAMRLRPGYPSWMANELARAYEMIGEYDRAKAIFVELADRASTDFWGRRAIEHLAAIAIYEGDEVLAKEYVERILGVSPSANLSGARRALALIADKGYLKHYFDALVKAGYPQHPPGHKSKSGPPTKPAIAVLPFANVSGDKDQKYLADGITEDLITDLSKNPNLLVIARNSSFAFRGQQLAAGEIAKRLGVEYIVEGSLQRDGDRLRVNAKLIDAKTNGNVWAERFEGGVSSVFDFQDTITREVVSAVLGSLSVITSETVATSKQGVSVRAYEKFLLARSNLRFGTADSIEQAINNFRSALDLEPDYADAHAGLASAYLMVRNNDWSIHLQLFDALSLAEEHAEKALSIRPVAAAHAVLADLAIKEGSWEAVRKEAESAWRLSPNDPLLLADLTRIFALDGQPERSLTLAEQAKRLDPQFTGVLDFAHAIALFVNERYADAEVMARRAAKIQGSATQVTLRLRATVLIASIASQGRPEEAAKVLVSLCADECTTEYALRTWPFRREVDRQRLIVAWSSIMKIFGWEDE